MLEVTLPYMKGSYTKGYFARKSVKRNLTKLADENKKQLQVRDYISGAKWIKPLGTGGAGDVWLVKRDSDSQLYAHKESKKYQEHLLVELIALLLLDHETIVNPYEIGEIPSYNDCVGIALRMSAIQEARTLYQYKPKVDSVNNLDETDDTVDTSVSIVRKNIGAKTLNIFKKVANGIKHAHDRGVIHRDLKPRNILVNKHGVHIIDFGCAVIQRPDIGVVISGIDNCLVGTPDYMAPESISQGSKSDFSTDIYSLVVSMYEIWTGQLPYGRYPQTTNEAVSRVIYQEPIDIREISPIKSKAFAKALLGALAKNQRDRTFKSTAEFVAFLNNVTLEKLSKKKALV